MWYWRDENFHGLREIAARLVEDAELKSFGDYCLLREQGLRGEAFAALTAFIESTKQWTVKQRRDFVRWLRETSIANPRVSDLVPHPLHKLLVEPMIEQWQRELPADPVPFRLGWNRESLATAVRLDPTHQETIWRLLKQLLDGIYFACHELPAGILGSMTEFLSELDEVEMLLPLLFDRAKRNVLGKELMEYREIAQNYSLYLDERRQGSSDATCFEDWAESRGRKCTIT